jgi:hypothetical protein
MQVAPAPHCRSASPTDRNQSPGFSRAWGSLSRIYGLEPLEWLLHSDLMPIERTADPSAALLMTKRRAGVSSGNWFEGSQVSKARPGAPFDFSLRYCRGHKLCHFSPDSLQRVGCSG